MATLLKTDGTKVQVSPKNKRFTLKELYELIGNGCDMIERVGPSKKGESLIVDEEGNFRESVIANWNATDWIAAEFGVMNVVVGNAVIVPQNEMFK